MRRIYAVLAIVFLLIGSYAYRVYEKPVLDDQIRATLPGQFIKLSQGVVHYELSGPDKGPVVVLIHGFSTPYYVWDKTVPALTEAGFRVLRYDHYGRGYSDRPAVEYTMDLYDHQLSELLAALKISEPVHLVGLSMGGGLAVVYSDRHEQQVRSLTLFAPLCFPPELTFSQQFVRTPFIGDYIVAWLGASMIREATRENLYQFDRYPEFLPKFDEQLQYRGVEPALLSSLRHLDYNLMHEAYLHVAQQHKPILLVWGREDAVLPFSTSHDVLELIPEARLLPVDQAGHTPLYEKPDIVNPRLVRFLKES